MTDINASNFLTRMFSPPFRGLTLAVWGFFIICFLVSPFSPILEGNLPDPDDYLYLTKTLDLLNGQNWFDPLQYRMNPPDGTFIHFSNLLCGFYALPIYALHFLMDARDAAIVVAALLPPFFFLLFLTNLRWASIPLLGRAYAGVTTFFALFATYTVFLFSPGHVDHHGIETVLAITACGCALRMESDFRCWRWSLLCGATTALGVAIALEFLPVLLMLSIWAGLRAIIQGKLAARQGLVFGLTLTLSCTVLLLIARGPAQFLTLDPLAYSLIYVLLTGGIFICLAGVALADLLDLALARYMTGFLLAAVIGTFFLMQFPALKTGPYGGMNPALFKLMFDNISEALPILRKDASLSSEMLSLLWPVMALVATAYTWFNTRLKSLRWRWALIWLMLFTCTGLAAFYQNRVMMYAQVFAIPGLISGLVLLWPWTEKAFAYKNVSSARFLLLLAAGPLPMVLLPAFLHNAPLTTSVLLFPNMTVNPACDVKVLAQILEMPVYYGQRPRIIINSLNEGSELLFRTQHKVLSAPYHENVSGNLDATTFFTTTDAAEAKAIARRRGGELVVLCRTIAKLYAPYVSDTMTVSEQGNVLPPKTSSFAQQLIAGQTPSWLKPIHFPTLGNMMLFEIKTTEP